MFLPTGTYQISLPEGQEAALRLRSDNVVLRGAGVDKTFLHCTTLQMHDKRVFLLKPDVPADWLSAKGATSLLAEDVPTPASALRVADTAGFAVGDLVVVRNDLTQHFIDLIGMSAKWEPSPSPNRTLCFCRRITAIDAGSHTLRFDVPVRGFLYQADNARVVKVPGHMLAEVGLEDFSVGQTQSSGEGLDEDETKLFKPGNNSYDLHDSVVLLIDHAENCWVRRVNSYCP